MNDFHFLRPYFLLLLIPFFIFVWLYIRDKGNSSIWKNICSKELFPYILGRKKKNQYAPYYIVLLVGSLIITALAGPSWEFHLQPLIKTQSGLIIALDMSSSMNVEDIKPSRLQRAIYKITDILNSRKEGQTALIVFSADPYVVTPITDDISTIKALLPALETNIMPKEGHHAEKAIEMACELLHQAGISKGSILLVGAELSDSEMEKAMDIANKQGVVISVLGVGTDSGAPIANMHGGFVKDDKGALIVSMLSSENLSRLAKSTNGNYVKISSDDSDVHGLTKAFSNASSHHSHELTEVSQNKWHDSGYWLVMLALPFVSLFFRRGIFNVLFIMVFFLMPQSVQGLAWKDFWKTPDQQGQMVFHQEDYQEAKELFQHSDWKAAANYRLGDFEQAAELFQCNTTAEGHYNCGTAKARKGDYEGALESYAKALEIDPNHEDTLYNKKIIEEIMQKDDQKNNENKDKNNDKKEDKKDQKNNDKKDDTEQQNQDNKKSGDQDNEDPQDQKESQQDKNKENSDLNDQKNEDNSEKNDEKQTKDLEDQYRDEMTEKIKENEKNKDKEEASEAALGQEQDDSESKPQRQMDDRWLQKVTDDPGGLLRRKFLQQYRYQNQTK